jgi:glutathione synthase/RimK-type ligase-like ATP-grasp enzyme
VPADAAAVAEALETMGATDAVLKPTISASGVGVERVRPGGEAAAIGRMRATKAADRLLVQEFVPEIAGGELGGVFFDGRFSHGLRRVPAPHDFRVNAQYGGHCGSRWRSVVRSRAGAVLYCPRRWVGRRCGTLWR